MSAIDLVSHTNLAAQPARNRAWGKFYAHRLSRREDRDMTWFAVLFAIINLLIAYGLVRLYVSVTASEHVTPSQATQATHGAGKPDEVSLPRSTSSTQVDPTEVNEPEVKAVQASAENRADAKTAAQTQSWTQEEQLQAIGRRIRYAQSVAQKHLAKDAAAQLRDWAVSWQRQLEGYLKDGPTPADAEQIEMCLAQIESTLSNLDAIAWDDAVETTCRRLEHEFALLEKTIRTLHLNEPAPDAMQACGV
jgi:hypothetical protein